jgi:hypothetical protein
MMNHTLVTVGQWHACSLYDQTVDSDTDSLVACGNILDNICQAGTGSQLPQEPLATLAGPGVSDGVQEARSRQS